ncbi:MAG TPA: SDR family oxidoreductase [Solirubrobacteraceae bacterium]|jgi:NAD(P)-dependent dehydrogenase (short-subunit alcohol dehydrogenase family)|nr:SDR family oxidoreductase [Solirubrobacteraceae bacterium]
MTRVVVVTGAAGGIGAATCDLLENYGWDVIAVDRLPVERPGALQVDIADADAVTAALSALPRVDALVNNAALQLYKSLLDTTVEEWDAVAAVNIRGAFVCLKAVHKQLAAVKGSVVNVGSVHANATSHSIAAYAATKGGLSAFTRAAALEMAPLGVRVNTVLPGATDTPALRAGFSRKVDSEQTLVDRTPLKRIGHPRDVAQAIAFLIDQERSAFITGQDLAVDGGALARLSTE